MKTISQLAGRRWIAVIGCLALGGFVWGQTISSGSQSVLQTLIQERQTLAQQASAFFGQGTVTPSSLEEWQNQHVSEIQALQQNAQLLGAQSEMQPIPYITEINIPDDASPDMVDFLTTQATLANGLAQIHNQHVQNVSATSGSVSLDAMTQVENDEATQYQQQYATQIQAQRQRAQVLSTTITSLPIPGPLVIPASATPQMSALLTLRDQLVRSQVQVWNQNLTSDTATRNAAMDSWHQQNAANFKQLAQLAQNLTTSN
jgi:hypothetical protein